MLELNKRMDAEMLKMVCGGNYGDDEKDTNPGQSMYEVGQEVELFNTVFHSTTTRRKIEAKNFQNGCWQYKFIIREYSHDDSFMRPYDKEYWFTAKKIER